MSSNLALSAGVETSRVPAARDDEEAAQRRAQRNKARLELEALAMAKYPGAAAGFHPGATDAQRKAAEQAVEWLADVLDAMGLRQREPVPARIPQREPDLPREPQPARPTTGRCPECQQQVTLTPVGRIDRHPAVVVAGGRRRQDRNRRCAGYSRLPETDPQENP